jgi:hypothetical protein
MKLEITGQDEITVTLSSGEKFVLHLWEDEGSFKMWLDVAWVFTQEASDVVWVDKE